MKKLLLLAAVLTVVSSAALTPSLQAQTVRFRTTYGAIDVKLMPEHAPQSVSNFLYYVTNQSSASNYDGSVFHRSSKQGLDIIQGGGFKITNNQVVAITAQAAIPLEAYYSNTRGTLAMARSTDPNSATDQWYFNVSDEDTGLDGQYAVFGRITNSYGLAVMDAIAALTAYNLSSSLGSSFVSVPLHDLANNTYTADNFVYVQSVRVLPAPDFFSGEVPLDNGVYYLRFPNGTPFGYYTYLDDPAYVYHFDMGYEYVFDAQDGNAGVYLYDFKSQHFFYTSPTFPFPYLYDFTLRAFLYYFPDPNNAGHYNTGGTRYFCNLSTGAIFTQ